MCEGQECLTPEFRDSVSRVAIFTDLKSRSSTPVNISRHISVLLVVLVNRPASYSSTTTPYDSNEITIPSPLSRSTTFIKMSELDSSSYMNIGASQPSIIDAPSESLIEHDELDELPSEPDSDEVTVSEDEHETDAEREWKESMQQLELLLSMVLIPYLGKYFGRKFAFWGWKQFMEWKYPVEVVVTSPVAFKGAGAVAAASL